MVKLGPSGVDVCLATGRVMHADWGEIEAHTITPGGRIGALLVRSGKGRARAMRVLPISTRLIGAEATEALLAALKDTAAEARIPGAEPGRGQGGLSRGRRAFEGAWEAVSKPLRAVPVATALWPSRRACGSTTPKHNVRPAHATFDYDLFVIGGGSGGVRAGRVAAETGAKVALAEEYRMGGTCVIRGCVPKKLMVFASTYGPAAQEARGYGWDYEGGTVQLGPVPAASWPPSSTGSKASTAAISARPG